MFSSYFQDVFVNSKSDCLPLGSSFVHRSEITNLKHGSDLVFRSGLNGLFVFFNIISHYFFEHRSVFESQICSSFINIGISIINSWI
ncbi:hypothetical protein L6452_39438 [Arctium lappa]|uniref:Uncharacterized protein n=1 Tax=Arctium lappa TaxID=4217 RepID=A0ACB8XT19_ARCLA|nr:hypothetical protein L6452_39438 [Arctium lappa]